MPPTRRRFNGKRSKRTSLNKTKKRYTRVGLSKKSAVSLIKNTVMNMAEEKEVNTDPTTYGFNANNTSCSPAVSLVTPLENIASGNIDGSRIGNNIMLKRYDLRCNFYMNPSYISGATFRAGFVIVYLGRLKNDYHSMPSNLDLQKLKQDGSGTAGLDQTVLSTLRDDNLDFFTIVRKRKFKLGGSGSPYPNNDFSIQKSVIFKNILKGKVVWNDNQLAVNKSLYMWCHFVTVDSTTLTVTVPVNCDYYISCKYTDM